MHHTRTVAVSIVLLLLLVACGKSDSTVGPAGNATPSAPVPTTTSTVVPSATPETQVSPTATAAAPTGYLKLDGQQATSVDVSDPSQPANYATSEDFLYRAEPGADWGQIGRWDPALSLLVDPTDQNVLYSGGHPGCAVGGPAISLRKSSDGGQTWQTLLTGQNVRPMIVDPRNPQVIFGERCSLAVSVNGGQSWTDYSMTPSFDVSAMSLFGDRLYVLITSEGGTSRIRVIDVTDPANPKMGADLHEFWGGGTIVASSGRIIVGQPHGIDVSLDDGQTWSFSRTGLEMVTVSVNALAEPIPNEELSRKFGIYALAVDPTDASRLLAGTIRGLYSSQDGGQTWSRDGRIDEVPVNELAFGAGGALLYVTTDDGVVLLSNP